jgi:hypothetical protein
MYTTTDKQPQKKRLFHVITDTIPHYDDHATDKLQPSAKKRQTPINQPT